ncbi:hypothetical protein KDK_02260 [Dictyobacter kobayashii]|uniref:Uncharacterized protein n=1 Tax=Dictyobacter kobayashii TaxID=2014872 RepID=A0A402ABF6_9CHLR|nr:hypothetical protein KDK_02260 [Dictyobacter kobayashii]
MLGKTLDKAQRICDTTAHETSERKNNECLSKSETTVSPGTLTTEEWKAEQQLELSEYTNQFLSIRSHGRVYGDHNNLRNKANVINWP